MRWNRWQRPDRNSAVEPLLSVLFNDRDSAVREDAVRALGEIGDPQAVEYLFTAMQEPGLRTLAVEALGRIGDPRAVPVLIEIVTGARPPEVTRTVAGCGDQWNEELITQGAAVRALGVIGDERAIPSLVAALEPTFTRAEAAVGIGQIRLKGHSVPDSSVERSQDENLRFHVRETLTSAGWRAERPDVAGSFSLQNVMPKETIETLVSELIHEEDWRRMRATAACVAGGPRSVQALIEALRAGPPN